MRLTTVLSRSPYAWRREVRWAPTPPLIPKVEASRYDWLYRRRQSKFGGRNRNVWEAIAWWVY